MLNDGNHGCQSSGRLSKDRLIQSLCRMTDKYPDQHNFCRTPASLVPQCNMQMDATKANKWVNSSGIGCLVAEGCTFNNDSECNWNVWCENMYDDSFFVWAEGFQPLVLCVPSRALWTILRCRPLSSAYTPNSLHARQTCMPTKPSVVSGLPAPLLMWRVWMQVNTFLLKGGNVPKRTDINIVGMDTTSTPSANPATSLLTRRILSTSLLLMAAAQVRSQIMSLVLVCQTQAAECMAWMATQTSLLALTRSLVEQEASSTNVRLRHQPSL